MFRVDISDTRILAYDGKSVTFKYQKVGASRWRQITLDAAEFIRRYLQHVLPSGFVKVRHYGFLSPNFGVSLSRIRELICVLYETLRHHLPVLAVPQKLRPLACRHCQTLMKWVCFIRPVHAHSPTG